MNQEPDGKVREDAEYKISILAVIPRERSAEIERILSHTRWQLHVVHSLDEAVRALRDVPVSVVLCERQLPDGTWLDLLREARQLSPSPQTIVLSAAPDAAYCAEVFNHGGYDVLARPLHPRELYALVPMAWRQWSSLAEKTPPAAKLKTMLQVAR